MLTNFRYFGFGMNPVSFYYCFDTAGERVETVVAEVSNTPWNERHCYVLSFAVSDAAAMHLHDEQTGTESQSTGRFENPKEFHVSPFMPMDMTYRWRVTEPRELLARLRAILRRKGFGAPGRDKGAEVLHFGRLDIDKGARSVRLDGEEKALTSYQYALLLALAERAGRVLSREALMDLLKGEKLEAFDRSVDVHISRIRALIEDDAKKPRRILTVRGAGYVFARDQDR